MTGKPLFDKILLGLNILIIAGVGYVFYAQSKMEPYTDTNAELNEFNQTAIAETKSPPYALPKMTINLLSPKTRLHYLDTEVHLVLMKENYRSDIDDKKHGYKHQIISIIIETASALTPDQISTVSGKILLAERIKNNINIRVGKKIIQKVLFTRFVIQ